MAPGTIPKRAILSQPEAAALVLLLPLLQLWHHFVNKQTIALSLSAAAASAVCHVFRRLDSTQQMARKQRELATGTCNKQSW